MALSAVNMAWLPLFFETASDPQAPRRYARYSLLFLGGAAGLTALSIAAAPEVLALLAAPAFGPAWRMVPVLAAWAPNAIFGCVAIYLLLTVRT